MWPSWEQRYDMWALAPDKGAVSLTHLCQVPWVWASEAVAPQMSPLPPPSWHGLQGHLGAPSFHSWDKVLDVSSLLTKGPWSMWFLSRVEVLSPGRQVSFGQSFLDLSFNPCITSPGRLAI